MTLEIPAFAYAVVGSGVTLLLKYIFVSKKDAKTFDAKLRDELWIQLGVKDKQYADLLERHDKQIHNLREQYDKLNEKYTQLVLDQGSLFKELRDVHIENAELKRTRQ